MQIVCPHCTTSYVIDPATLGPAGRTVRCSRCKEVWLARPENAFDPAADALESAEASLSGTNSGSAADWDVLARDDDNRDISVVDGPSTSADLAEGHKGSIQGADWASMAGHETSDGETPRRRGWPRPRMPLFRASVKSFVSLRTACAAMGALVLALMIWRIEMVRLLPQTAAFYKLIGLDVNLRGLTFRDVKVTAETAEGKPVLVIEGVIVGDSRKPVDLPRLRFSVRDAQGAEIYAWNTVLEQSVLQPGERASFKSRLASPPAEGRNIDIRFFNRRDIGGGNA